MPFSLSVLLAACSSPPPSPPAAVTVLYSSRAEGEIEPCG